MSGSELSIINASQFLALKPLPEAREKAAAVHVKLDQILFEKIPKYTSEDTSLVVFGSLARGEWTSASDLDWTYLIDGQANSDHLVIAQKIQTILKDHFGRRARPEHSETWRSATTSSITNRRTKRYEQEYDSTNSVASGVGVYRQECPGLRESDEGRHQPLSRGRQPPVDRRRHAIPCAALFPQ